MAVSGTPKTSNPYTDIAPRGPAQNGLDTVAGAAPREPPSTASSKTDPDYDQDLGTDAQIEQTTRWHCTARPTQGRNGFLERLSTLLVQVLVAGVVVYLQHQPSPSLLVTSRPQSWFGPVEKEPPRTKNEHP